MLKILRARAAQGAKEERLVRKLAASRHGPADWIFHARMVVRSPVANESRPSESELDGSPQTVCRRLHRFDTEGIKG
jgi:hypothetical protein